jgi:hypothetical protein
MHASDAATWRLPLFKGRMQCRGMAFHIWDATDDFSGTDMDLLFEGHRLYLHDASGNFGAVPMKITGTPSPPPPPNLLFFTTSPADMDLLFEGHRLYIHDASGNVGGHG